MTTEEVAEIVRAQLLCERGRLANLIRQVARQRCSQCAAHDEHEVCDPLNAEQLADLIEGGQ